MTPFFFTSMELDMRVSASPLLGRGGMRSMTERGKSPRGRDLLLSLVNTVQSIHPKGKFFGCPESPYLLDSYLLESIDDFF